VERYRNKPFAVIGVNSQDNTNSVRRLMAEGKITWRSICGPAAGKIDNAYGLTGWPLVVLIDPKGKMHHIFRGRPQEADLDAKLDQMIAAAESGK
jgi:hypothetical protein